MRKKLKGVMDDMAVLVGSARIDERKAAAKPVTRRGVRSPHRTGTLTRRVGSCSGQRILKRGRKSPCAWKQRAGTSMCYDQYQRNTLYNAAEEFDFDVSKVTKKVETDCSALVRVCVNYAGIPGEISGQRTQAAVLMATGAFEKHTDDAHCRKSANLLRGDILVTRTRAIPWLC